MTRPRFDHRSFVLVGVTVALSAGLLAVTVVPAGARATRPRPVRMATEPSGDSDRTLVATGTARVRGVPDVLVLTLGVTSRDDTVGAALDRNSTAVDRMVRVLVDGGVAKSDIQTSSFSVSPVYDDRSNATDGYQVSNLVTVQMHDLDRTGSLIDEAVAAGGDDAVVQGLAFAFDDTSALVAQARTEAVRRARAQAEQLAEAAGVQLVEVRTISESSLDAGPIAAPEGMATRSDGAVPISPGSQELSVQVTLVFTIR